MVAYDLAAEDERELIVELAAQKDLRVPRVGAEGPDGFVLDVSWLENRLTVDLHAMPDEDREFLIAAGWVVLEPDADLIVRELQRTAAEPE